MFSRSATAFLAVLLLVPVVGPAGALPAQEGSPAGAVPVSALVARRTALLTRLGQGIAIIPAASERSNDPPDSDYPQDSDYRENNAFFYLTGLEAPDAWLVLIARPDGRSGTLLFLPPRDPPRERWLGAKLGVEEAARLTGLAPDSVLLTAGLEENVRGLVQRVTAEGGSLFLQRDRRSADNAFLQRLAETPGVRPADLLPHLAALRVVKDAEEIARLRRAAEISAEGHLAAIRRAAPGAFEYELEAEAEYVFRKLGAERVGYPSIVGTGMNGTVLHYDKSRARLADGDLVVMDMAAEYGYYSADITRTIPANGRFTSRQRALYDLVLGAQQAALDSVRPGVTVARLNAIARAWLRDHSGDLCGPKTCDSYMIHGLSHHIGMDVHDPTPQGLVLAPGMVFTIEPGVYLPEEGIGIRIEDDVLVTVTGGELLSAKVPRQASEIEALMNRRRSP